MLAIVLALSADVLFVLAQRVLTPWNRVRMMVASTFVDAFRFMPSHFSLLLEKAAETSSSRSPRSRSRS